MNTQTLVAVLIVTVMAVADQTLSANIGYLTGGSKACLACSPPDNNTFVLDSDSYYSQDLVSIPIANLNANHISSAILNGAFFDCAYPESFNITIGIPQDPSYKATPGLNGCNSACPYVRDRSATLYFGLDSSCSSSGVDVTDAVKAALSAGNDQFIFILSFIGQSCITLGNNGSVRCSASVKINDLTLTITSSSTPEPTCAPCLCGSTSGKRRSGCPVCNICTTEPPVEATCAACPCGSTSGKRRSGCPVCNVCTTEPPVEATCAPCPCGSSSGKRRSGCPVCNACPTNAPSTAVPSTVAPTTEPPVEATCAPCPCGSTSGKRRSGCPVCNTCPTNAPSTAAPTTSTAKPTTVAPTEPPVQQTPAPSTAAPTTQAPGQNIAGQNNARSSATTIALSGLTVIAAAIALL